MNYSVTNIFVNAISTAQLALTREIYLAEKELKVRTEKDPVTKIVEQALEENRQSHSIIENFLKRFQNV